ncbi:MAG: hypothetical protein MUF21_06215 [Gemmatimonadaceae bacterium]|nr:hypothetical protein [Gemmatimonadaceae bacterium]
MPLLAPELVAPLSDCSTRARVRGNIAGASIEILVDGTQTSATTATSIDGTYPIGAAVAAGATVTARQRFNGEVSPVGMGVIVQKAPAQPAALTLLSTPRHCGRAIRLQGAVPGATVEARIGAALVGSDIAHTGIAGFTYDPPLTGDAVLAIRQSTCTGATVNQQSPKGLPLPATLARPVIRTPLIECQTTITIDGVIDGAFVELFRNGALEKTYTFAERREWRRIASLKAGDVIEVRQGFKCKKDSPALEVASTRRSATVQTTAALGAPLFTTLLCPGSPFVGLAGLIPGARVVLSVDDKVIGETDAADSSVLLQVPALPSSGRVRAWMRLCRKDGPAASADITGGTGAPDGITVAALHQCASHVYLTQEFTGQPKSCVVYVTNAAGQHISSVHTLSLARLVPVSPSLVAGDMITVHALACGGSWKTYGPFPVTSTPTPLAPPEVPNQLYAEQKYVFVVSPYVGARIDLFVNGAWRGWAISTGTPGSTPVHFDVALKTGDIVTATQTLCGKVSKASTRNTVVKARPRAPVLVEPADGATGVAVQPTFRWQDPGAQLENKAESFRLRVWRPNEDGYVIDTTTTTTEFVSPTVLAHETMYSWTVRAINTSGETAPSPSFASFTTRAAAPAPTALLRFVPPINSAPPGFPRTQPFEIHAPLENAGSASSSAYTVWMAIFLHATGELVAQQQATFDPLAAGSSMVVYWPVNIGGSEDLRIEAYLLVDDVQVDYMFRIV